MVGIHHAARKHQRPEVVRTRIAERDVDLELVAPVIVLPGLDRSFLRRDESRFAPASSRACARFGELALFHAVGGEDGDAHSAKIAWCSHEYSSVE